MCLSAWSVLEISALEILDSSFSCQVTLGKLPCVRFPPVQNGFDDPELLEG